MEFWLTLTAFTVDIYNVISVFFHLVPLYCKTWLLAGLVIVTSVVKPDNAVVPETVIVLIVSLNVAPDRV